jgi:intracellular multiplication protein IcmC
MDEMSSTDNVLINLANSLIPVEKLLTGAAYIIGIWFAIKALLVLKAHTESRSQAAGGPTEPIMYLFVAAMLIYFPSAFQMLMNTTFGYSNVLAYAPNNTQMPLINAVFGQDSPMGQALTIIIQIVGLISYIRGWLLLAKAGGSGQQPGNVGKGITHIFAGILALNIIGTLQVISNTLYGAG